MTVKAALYAKYYFELRGLFNDNAQEFPIEPLNQEKAAELEGRSKWISEVEKKRAVSQTQVNPRQGGGSNYIIS